MRIEVVHPVEGPQVEEEVVKLRFRMTTGGFPVLEEFVENEWMGVLSVMKGAKGLILDIEEHYECSAFGKDSNGFIQTRF